MTSNPRKLNTEKPDQDRAVRNRMVQVIVQWLITATILFVAAGTLIWPAAWALMVVQAGVLTFNYFYILPRNPEGVAERAEIKAGTKRWDRIVTGLITFGVIGQLLVSGLDYRFGWSPTYSLWLHVTGLLCVALGNLLFSWALVSNKYFATTVRIQEERGHQVTSSGPYRYVRHPGYVGYITFSMAMPIGLGALWGLIPAVFIAIGMVIRTALEDRTLRAELLGYEQYTASVRYRLLPGVW
jgi:protein-S-isoprenylcysteine O-methyltransferase Ste14